MSNPSRAKGTRGENYFLERLRTVWPTVERAPLKGVHDRGDYVNVPFPIEAKCTAKPLFQQWVRTLRFKAAGERWALLWKGDRRTSDGAPVVVIDIDFALELFELWERTLSACALRHPSAWELALDAEGEGISR